MAVLLIRNDRFQSFPSFFKSQTRIIPLSLKRVIFAESEVTLPFQIPSNGAFSSLCANICYQWYSFEMYSRLELKLNLDLSALWITFIRFWLTVVYLKTPSWMGEGRERAARVEALCACAENFRVQSAGVRLRAASFDENLEYCRKNPETCSYSLQPF